MRNRILAVTKHSIPYVKELRDLAGSVTACILWQQLDYWFDNMGETFYKFLGPCEHQAYRVGDSWTEELGFSRDEFRTAFDKIGTRYSSKAAFRRESDPFQGKYFASFHDKIKGLTFYIRNHKLTDAALDSIFVKENSSSPVNRKPQSTERPNSHSRKERKSTPIEVRTEITQNTTTTLDENLIAIFETLLLKLPRELQLDEQIKAVVAQKLQLEGEDYVLSNFQAMFNQAKSSKKGFLLKALNTDFGHLYRSKKMAEEEKQAKLTAERQEREANRLDHKETGQSRFEEFKRWAEDKERK